MELTSDELNKNWLIFGVGGQDGSWYCDMLLEMGYKNIHGTIRRSSTFNTSNIDHIFDKLKLHYCDLTDTMNIYKIIEKVQPNYIVNFAAQSHVKVSHELENYTLQVNTLGVLNILQSVRELGLGEKCKIYQASTSELYGNQTNGIIKLDENSPQNPVSIYGISKRAAEDICNMYRDAYGMFIVNSILFNHTGPRRGHTFVTQKIADYVAKYKKSMDDKSKAIQLSHPSKVKINKHKTHTTNYTKIHPVWSKDAVSNLFKSPRKTQEQTVEELEELTLEEQIPALQLGNLNARRDWGLASEYCKAIYLMLMQDIPQNFVIATGETHSVREFVELAFNEIGISIKWEGSGINEVGKNEKTNDILVKVNPRYYRDIDIECLIGNASKAKEILKWEYKLQFKELVQIMVDAAIKRTT